MAWTAPKTFTSGSVLTAAELNTHLRDNLNETAPAKAAAAGDIFYATAANTIAKLAAGTNGQVLRGGASAPAWSSSVLGSFNFGSAATSAAPLHIYGNSNQLRLHENDATDTSDYIDVEMNGDEFRVTPWDNSAGSTKPMVQADFGDYLLHSGVYGTGTGAVIIATDSSPGIVSLTNAGANFLTAAVATGGAAYIFGTYSVRLQRDGSGSGEDVRIQVRQDGTSMDAAHGHPSGLNVLSALVPNLNDEHTFFGSFYRRVTAADSSTYQIWVACDTSNRFDAEDGFLYVQSIQYPT